ncbi:hypothetical protein D1872_283570 [compost metagenome]
MQVIQILVLERINQCICLGHSYSWSFGLLRGEAISDGKWLLRILRNNFLYLINNREREAQALLKTSSPTILTTIGVR